MNLPVTNINTDTEKEPGWNRRSWLWVLLCTIVIFFTVPFARSIQKFIYSAIGKEFFTYAVLFVICAVLVVTLYFLIFKLRIVNLSRYVWLLASAGLYVFFTFQLRQNPEEAVHLLEFGILSYFIFRAFSCKIHDWTIYMVTTLSILFIGTADEFIQWLMPTRYWSYKDVGINGLAGFFFAIAVGKGIRPKIISKPVQSISVKILAGIITLNLFFLGLCLSNTPDAVKRYTSVSKSLWWLRNEEPMTEFGYKHKDPEIGVIYSRLPLKKIRESDLNRGKTYGKIISKDINSNDIFEELLKTHTPHTNAFLYEFLSHILKRNNRFKELQEPIKHDEKIEISSIAYRENLILEKYFKNTLKHSKLEWSDKQKKDLQKTDSLWNGNYISKTGINVITSFSLKTAWLIIISFLILVWTSALRWTRRLDN